jgi:hypothetical protein
MSLKRLRAGELLALVGVLLVAASLLLPWYDSRVGHLDAWETFGPSVALLLADMCAALALIVSALTERSTALPIASAVWCVPLGLLGLIAAVVRVLERPDSATGVLIGAWLALFGAAAILVGSWLALRDERPALYQPATPPTRPAP